jgi:hypothetical protein
MRRVKSQLTRQERPVPEAVSRAEQSRPKLVDITGADPETLDPTDAVGSDEITEQVRAVGIEIEIKARFTSGYDRTVVQNMLFALEWTMLGAVEGVLVRRGASASLTARPEPRSFKRWWVGVAGRVREVLRGRAWIRPSVGDGESAEEMLPALQYRSRQSHGAPAVS